MADQPRDHAIHAADMTAVQRLEGHDLAMRGSARQRLVDIDGRRGLRSVGQAVGHVGCEHSQWDARVAVEV
jgi:hypothetical protein